MNRKGAAGGQFADRSNQLGQFQPMPPVAIHRGQASRAAAGIGGLRLDVQGKDGSANFAITKGGLLWNIGGDEGLDPIGKPLVSLDRADAVPRLFSFSGPLRKIGDSQLFHAAAGGDD